MIVKNAYTIPYHLRPLKAIERNLFVTLLKKIDNHGSIDLSDYRYVGFGAPFLEDFKLMHLEFGIFDMDCIEYEYYPFSRQAFNNPFNFVKLYHESCTDYINSGDFKQDKNQIVWLDFASPREFRQQLFDVELISAKLADMDIVKLTFNANDTSVVSSNQIKKCSPPDYAKILDFFKKDQTYKTYVPATIRSADFIHDFSVLIRSMAINAVRRGLATQGNDLEFNHLTSFSYADGQMMTTITGLICSKEKFDALKVGSGISKWEFFQDELASPFITSNEIVVPVMTISERMAIDKLIPLPSAKEMAEQIDFFYGSNEDEHLRLLDGYRRYYKYLPHYSKVTY